MILYAIKETHDDAPEDIKCIKIQDLLKAAWNDRRLG